MNEKVFLNDRVLHRKPKPLQEDLSKLYSEGFLTDITLSTEDRKSFEAHKIILAARSFYFHSIVLRLKSDPVVHLRGIYSKHLDYILKFIYGGNVALPKDQLEETLAVAKALEVKGLNDVTVQDVLTRQTGLGGGVVSAGRFKPDSPLASPVLSKVVGQSTRSSSQLVDKMTLTSFRASRGAKPSPATSTTSSLRSGRTLQNGSPVNSDSEKEKDEESEGPKTRKGRRGRPRKVNKEKEAKAESAAAAVADPYEFEEDSENKAGSGDEAKSGGGGKRGFRSHSKGKKSDEDGKEEKGGYAINGKSVLSVQCNSEVAELHLHRFQSGIRGNSIKYNSQWMTPQEFALIFGFSGKKYLDKIQTDYGPLKALTASGMLKAASRESSRTTDNDSPRPKRRKSAENEDDEDEEGEDDENDDAEDGIEDEDEDEEEEDEDDDDDDDQDTSKDTEDGVETAEASTYTSMRKKKKKKSRNGDDDWKRQIVASQMKTESPSLTATPNGIEEIDAQQLNTLQMATGELVQVVNNTYAVAVSQPSRIMEQPQTVYVMPPPTPQHNPFATALSPPTPPISTFTIASTTSSSTTTSTVPRPSSLVGPKLGSVINIRCKSTTALLYTNKYESGSKGKCIQLGDEWLTPNEFEERAGSKAKKYLSSIKCMGRPLRVYVNSGELKGSGPPPPPKGPKVNKQQPNNMMVNNQQKLPIVSQTAVTTHPPPSMTPVPPAPSMTPVPQPIAPAPIQAPPTPSHISSAPAIPVNLGATAQPPILINQNSSMANTMGQNLFQPMTFTIAQPLEVRPNTQAM